MAIATRALLILLLIPCSSAMSVSFFQPSGPFPGPSPGLEPSSPDPLGLGGPVQPERKKEGDCHQPEKGGQCYKAITWALEHGLANHSDWYPGVTLEADGGERALVHNRRQIQKSLFRQHHWAGCGKPCAEPPAVQPNPFIPRAAAPLEPVSPQEPFPGLEPSSAGPLGGAVQPETKVEDPPSSPDPLGGPVQPERKKEGDCHQPEEGGQCYKAITWALEHGLANHSDWYPGVTLEADGGDRALMHNRRQIQKSLFRQHWAGCGKPCTLPPAVQP